MRLLFWVNLLVLVFAVAGNCRESSPQSMNESIPLTIHYSYGACHAEWGKTDIWIDDDGVGLYESGSGNLIFFNDGQRFEQENFRKTFNLNETELKELLHEIEDGGFYFLDDSYFNPEVRDGSCEDISIAANNSTKTVFLSNTAAPQAYERVAQLIEGMAKNKTQVVPYSIKTFQSLIEDLNDSSSVVRSFAASALGDLNDSSAVDSLILALNDSDYGVRRTAASALGHIKDARAVQPLILSLQDDYSGVRRSVALALGELKDGRAVEPLILALQDDYNMVRFSAAIALGEIADPRSFGPLEQALNDSDSDVREAARRAMDCIGNVMPEVGEVSDSHNN